MEMQCMAKYQVLIFEYFYSCGAILIAFQTFLFAYK